MLRLSTFSFMLLASSSVLMADFEWDVTGGIVAIHQGTKKANIKPQNSASIDFILDRPLVGGDVVIHFEGATTPKDESVATYIPESNSDSGTALDKDNQGRFQLSQLYYTYTFASESTLTAGLVDLTGFFEQSRIASDEVTQFLGTFFTSNPTIDFPDYTLGAIYEQTIYSNVVLRSAIASAKGLADNNTRSYSQLLSLDDTENGLFAIASATYNYENFYIRAGIWTNKADHTSVRGDADQLDNYGVYSIAGYEYEDHALNMRIGHARENVNRGSDFVALSYQYLHNAYLFGIGAGEVFLSPKQIDKNLGDTTQYELYVRYEPAEKIYITFDFQTIYNSNFGEIPDLRNKYTSLYGVRLSYLF